MRIAIAQINSTLGSFNSNAKKIEGEIQKAAKQGVDLLVFPEASLFGYHPMDLLERAAIVDEQNRCLEVLNRKIPQKMSVLVGAITKNPKKKGKPYHNSAVLLRKDKALKIFPKELLPTYDVFDEGRHIESGDVTKNIFSIGKTRVLVTICEDIWGWPSQKKGERVSYSSNPLKKIDPKKVDLVVNLSASPFTVDKIEARKYVVSQTAKYFKSTVVYANMVGAQDELIFDGGSFFSDFHGNVISQAERFKKDFLIFDTEAKKIPDKQPPIKPLTHSQLHIQGLTLGLRDFAEKCGFKKLHLGLSGGIDSAVVAAIAVNAVGAKNVSCIAMPSEFNSNNSLIWAQRLTKNLGAEWFEIPITPSYQQLVGSFESATGALEFGLTHENIQARIRCLFLMAFSNSHGSLLLNPSNKSEFAMGYSTLYGDLSGGLCVIGDLLKTEVFALANEINREEEVIPQEIIDRPPSAELKPNQKDSDSLPPYEDLDKAIVRLVVDCKPARTKLEKRILKSLMRSEFKRWQAPPILKISNHSFGQGRRLPIAHQAIF